VISFGWFRIFAASGCHSRTKTGVKKWYVALAALCSRLSPDVAVAYDPICVVLMQLCGLPGALSILCQTVRYLCMAYCHAAYTKPTNLRHMSVAVFRKEMGGGRPNITQLRRAAL